MDGLLWGAWHDLQNVCDALAAYGTNATPALPQLTNLLSHPKEVVREAAERAVERINGLAPESNSMTLKRVEH